MSEKIKDKQVGGDHYKKYPIQPVDYIVKNGLGFLEGNVVKYVTRYKDKNGAEDLRKAVHNLELLLLEYESKEPPKKDKQFITKEGCPACAEAPLTPGEWRRHDNSSV